ncbi:MAG: hypothetical protein BGO55_14135 [Sphingobacteriales bacterium 50-39]|nr:hypothetical protein [Sphingobacteriales bacterium]OJW57430.1 MAG: hypothetical protein BGO55_14135 [Sphingobacteriales bacterium 50-39]
MYHSHSYQDEAFDFFVTFLKNAIKGDVTYQQLVLPVITDAHLLATGEKDYFTINRDSYSVITFLVEADTPYFRQLNTNHLTTADYSQILQYANTQREAFLA